MPHFFFDTYSSFVDIDEVGQELPNLEAVRREIRKSLPAMLSDDIADRDKAQFRIDVRDASGKCVVTASALMILDCLEDPA